MTAFTKGDLRTELGTQLLSALEWLDHGKAIRKQPNQLVAGVLNSLIAGFPGLVYRNCRHAMENLYLSQLSKHSPERTHLNATHFG